MTTPNQASSSMAEARREFLSEGHEILTRLSALLTQPNIKELSHENLDALYRDVHTLKGSAQLFGFKHLGTVAHAAEACLEPVRQGNLALDEDMVDHILQCLDLIERILQNPDSDLNADSSLVAETNHLVSLLANLAIEKRSGETAWHAPRDGYVSDEQSLERAASISKVSPIVEIKKTTLKASTENPQQKAEAIVLRSEEVGVETVNLSTGTSDSSGASDGRDGKAGDSPVSGEASTIRVQVSLLDRLMNLVGELVLVRNQVLQHAKSSEDNAYLNLTARLDLVTAELQDQAMRTRMQPVGLVFSKFQRTVRDLSRDLNKKIELKILGAETELDKSLIEAIKDPLTHIVRNSCDHGLEPAADRKAAGKIEKGTLSLNAYQEGGQVVIEIVDDGRGIDPDRIIKKVVEKGLMSPEKIATLTQQQIQELIFVPGFSTASEVTSVSGRGVGMDVVRANIERVGGIIDLQSKPGKGTTLKLRIPLTLAIVPAMVVQSSGINFAIPQIKLQELLLLETTGERNRVERLQGELFYRLRGELLPLVNLSSIMGTHHKDTPLADQINVAVVKSENALYGLILDDISDTADMVVKPLSGFVKHIPVFSGATILGDGSVALILDISGLAQYSSATRRHKSDSKSDVTNLSETFNSDMGEYLIFRISGKETYAIPLVLVSRLEEFEASQIQRSGNDFVVSYRGGLLPILSLDQCLGLKKSDQVPVYKDRVPVIVCSKRNRFYGFAVSEILDVISLESDVSEPLIESPGILGTLLAPDKSARTVVDVLGILGIVSGESEEFKSQTKTVKLSKKSRVLLVEDTPFFVKQITKVLEEMGLEVVHASDGEVALKILEENAEKNHFDLIVSDIEMPRMNGFELAVALKEHSSYKKIPLVALTTRFREVDQAKGRQVGFDAYLEKLKRDDLSAVVTKFLGAKQ